MPRTCPCPMRSSTRTSPATTPRSLRISSMASRTLLGHRSLRPSRSPSCLASNSSMSSSSGRPARLYVFPLFPFRAVFDSVGQRGRGQKLTESYSLSESTWPRGRLRERLPSKRGVEPVHEAYGPSTSSPSSAGRQSSKVGGRAKRASARSGPTRSGRSEERGERCAEAEPRERDDDRDQVYNPINELSRISQFT